MVPLESNRSPIANMGYRVLENGQVFKHRIVIRTTGPPIPLVLLTSCARSRSCVRSALRPSGMRRARHHKEYRDAAPTFVSTPTPRAPHDHRRWPRHDRAHGDCHSAGDSGSRLAVLSTRQWRLRESHQYGVGHVEQPYDSLGGGIPRGVSKRAYPD
jgi:hypothetical protein